MSGQGVRKMQQTGSLCTEGYGLQSWRAPGEKSYESQPPNSVNFDADDWYLYEYAPGRERHVRSIHIHFTETAGAQIKLLLKQYAAWRIGRVKPVTVRLELQERLSHWSRYLAARQMTEPERFGSGELGGFLLWMRAQDMSENACNRTLHTVCALIRNGQRLGWRVSGEPFPTDIACWKQQLILRSLHSSDMLSESVSQYSQAEGTEPIPPDIYEQIIRHAREDQTDEITRSGILIQSQTGLRISEVLSLQENCMHRDPGGGWWLVYRMKKTQRAEPVNAYTPANELIREAVQRLQTATEELRRESGRKELFLNKNHGIRQVSQANWNKGRLRSFMRRWKITAADGTEYELHSHQFRATYVRQQMLSGGHIEDIRCRFGHASSEMTAQYVHLSETEIADFLLKHTNVYASLSGTVQMSRLSAGGQEKIDKKGEEGL